MEQIEAFHETLGESLNALVSALGGKKAIATVLWPEKPVDEAARYLADCLNPDRAAKLDPEKLLLLLKLGREKGIHVAMAWILEAVGYAPPQPIEPEDQMAALQRAFIQSVEQQKGIVERMARLGITPAQLRATSRG